MGTDGPWTENEHGRSEVKASTYHPDRRRCPVPTAVRLLEDLAEFDVPTLQLKRGVQRKLFVRPGVGRHVDYVVIGPCLTDGLCPGRLPDQRPHLLEGRGLNMADLPLRMRERVRGRGHCQRRTERLRGAGALLHQVGRRPHVGDEVPLDQKSRLVPVQSERKRVKRHAPKATVGDDEEMIARIDPSIPDERAEEDFEEAPTRGPSELLVRVLSAAS